MTNHDAINVWSVSSASAEATDWIRSSLLILFVGFATLASLICKIPQMVIWMIFQKLMDYSCGNLGQSGKPNVVCKTNASCFSIISIFMFENSVLPFAGEVWWFYPSLPLQSLISLWMCCFLLVESAIFVDLIFIFWWSKYRCSFVQAFYSTVFIV